MKLAPFVSLLVGFALLCVPGLVFAEPPSPTRNNLPIGQRSSPTPTRTLGLVGRASATPTATPFSFQVIASRTPTPTSRPFQIEPSRTPTATDLPIQIAPSRTPTPTPFGLGQQPGDGELREVDAVYVSLYPQPALAVSAVGTGGSFRLSSWQLDNAHLPDHLLNTPTQQGYDIKLLTLSPAQLPPSTPRLFLSAARRNGELWLTAWTMNAAGTMTKRHENGYGDGVVAEYAMAMRPLTSNGVVTAYQVVTPIRLSNDHLRLITWQVHPTTGIVAGLDDSGDWQRNGQPETGSQLNIAPQGHEYVVTYRVGGDLRTRYWDVAVNGQPSERGSGVSGLDLRGEDVVSEPANETTVSALGSSGFVTAVEVDGSRPKLVVWESRLTACDGGCVATPHRITDTDADQAPNADGIVQASLPALTDSTDSNGATQQVRALLTDATWESTGVGEGALYAEMPAGEPLAVGVASVTKNMTLLLAVEAVKAGEVSLTDWITVSQTAADTGGSTMNLDTGEQVQFRTLLYGMMLRSGNDASVAIAEHIDGDVATFATRMMDKAQALGMSNSTYCHPAGGCYSTPQDQLTLWMAATEEPLFNTVASAEAFDACGTLNGEAKCYFLTKLSNGGGYPGLGGWKGGNGGFFCSGFSGVPFCTSCVVAEAERLNRRMIVGLQQTGDRWGDTFDLFDYGFIQQFTPDWRAGATNAQQGQYADPSATIRDHALDTMGNLPALTAVVQQNNTLQMCTWSANAGIGQLNKLGCVSYVPPALPGGAPVSQTAGIEMALTDNLGESEGDYLTAHASGTVLRLNLYRIAPLDATF